MNTCGLPLVPDGGLLVANGKQALSLVAQDLRDRGVRTLLAPNFYCLTMIQPFQLEGIKVRHVATDARALLDSQALAEELATGHHLAVLHCEVFGGLAGARLRDVLDAAQAEGVPVVVDVTHSLFATSHGPADYLVASLRKLLPVPDGAFVTGLPGRPAVARHGLDAMATRWGLIAERRRRDLVTGRGSAADYLDAVDVAEEAMLGAREPASMSRAALRRLSRLDPDAVRQARQVNAAYLIECLTSSGVEAVNPTTPECGVVVQVEDAPSVERDLLAAGILCSISWPRPPGLRHHIPWPTRWVTLPVDPDLAPHTLDRAASIVEQAASPAEAGSHPRSTRRPHPRSVRVKPPSRRARRLSRGLCCGGVASLRTSVSLAAATDRTRHATPGALQRPTTGGDECQAPGSSPSAVDNRAACVENLYSGRAREKPCR